MSEQEHSTEPADPLFQPLVDCWTSCAREASESTRKLLGEFSRTSDPGAWRRFWFDVLGQQTDTFLRTPLFLQTMKSHIESLVRARHVANVAESHELIAERLQHLEDAMRSQLQALEQRVEALESKNSPSRHLSAGWNQFLRALRPSGSVSRMGVTPHDVVYSEGSLRLLRYHNDAVRFAEPVLICFALVNRPYILDLQEGRSVVQQLLAGGFDVYLIDWGIPKSADRRLRLEDYVCRFLRNAVNVACDIRQTRQLNLLGYCMGGTMSAMFTALYPERVRNLILMAAPIDFDDREGLLNLWARREYFDVDRLIDAYGNCPGEFLRYCFQLMKPVQNFTEKFLTFCERLDDRPFLENFLAMERWASDSIPVAGETFREFVKLLYQQNRLVKGEMMLGECPVRLQNIACPQLLLTAEQDHLVRPSSTLAIQTYSRSSDVSSVSANVGHIGLAVSTKAHSQLWPSAVTWIAGHSTKRN